LLFYKRPARADRIRVGSLTIDAPETSEAWWVVDGQQRVTALTAALRHLLPLPTRPSREDPYALYLDAQNRRFEPPPTSGSVPSTWVPLPHLLDASHLTEWVFGWEHGNDAELRRIVFEAGSRVREFSIPLYLIEPGQDDVAQQIFYRINQAGKPLGWEDVHRALFGERGASPATLEELSEELAQVGMGHLGEDRLLTCLVSLRGKDPTRTLDEHLRRDPEVLRDAVSEALPVLRRVLSFLRSDAGIPHLRLLPKSILLDVLTRFFALHQDPRSRARILLARWLWRTVLGAGAFDDRTLRRRGIGAVGEDEEESIQNLLGLVRKERPRPYELPAAFDARADQSKIALLALAHRRPRDLRSAAPLDLPSLLDDDPQAFAKIVTRSSSVRAVRSPANRTFHPKGVSVRKLLRDRIAEHGPVDPVVASHVIDERAATLLEREEPEPFLERRSELLIEEVRRFGERVAAWDHSDRPSVEHLLEEAGVTP
jgi:hypothetical protein